MLNYSFFNKNAVGRCCRLLCFVSAGRKYSIIRHLNILTVLWPIPICFCFIKCVLNCSEISLLASCKFYFVSCKSVPLVFHAPDKTMLPSPSTAQSDPTIMMSRPMSYFFFSCFSFPTIKFAFGLLTGSTVSMTPLNRWQTTPSRPFSSHPQLPLYFRLIANPNISICGILASNIFPG